VLRCFVVLTSLGLLFADYFTAFLHLKISFNGFPEQAQEGQKINTDEQCDDSNWNRTRNSSEGPNLHQLTRVYQSVEVEKQYLLRDAAAQKRLGARMTAMGR
jgi:hypothetical protein